MVSRLWQVRVAAVLLLASAGCGSENGDAEAEVKDTDVREPGIWSPDCEVACKQRGAMCGTVTVEQMDTGYTKECDCGTCPAGQICTEDASDGNYMGPLGVCCQPDCGEMTCGDDGCGGTCPECDAGLLCLGSQCVSPWLANPVLSFNEPAGKTFACQEQVALTMVVQEWDPDLPAAGAKCYLDGAAAGTVAGWQVSFPAMAQGYHSACCFLTWYGVAGDPCTTGACLKIRVACPCSGSDDPACDDGHPCSLDACASVDGSTWECSYSWSPDSSCCVSNFDCPCDAGSWMTCVDNTCAR
jgi:hypothetical protein